VLRVNPGERRSCETHEAEDRDDCNHNAAFEVTADAGTLSASQ
jgi:hypothetical protein